MEKPNRRFVWQIVIAVLAAIAVWIYVETVVSPEVTMNVRNIPVEFSGEDTTLAEKGFMILSGYDTTVDLKLKGSRRVLYKLDSDNIRIVADTSAINSLGIHSLNYTVYYPDQISRSSVTVEHASVYAVTVSVGELYKKEVPVKCVFNGEVAEGYTAGDLVLDPEVLTLRAQRDDLLSVSYAQVEVNISGATDTVIQTVDFTLYDYNDIPVSKENIRAGAKLIQVTLPIRTVKEVPLKVELVGAPGNTENNLECSIEPATVRLLGEASTLRGINEVVLDTIYVEDLVSYQTFSYSIKPPMGTALVSEKTTATVTVVVSGASEQVMKVDRIAYENLPNGLNAALVTRSLDVTLWGLTGELESLTPDDILITADLSALTAPGEYTVEALVTVYNHSNIGVKGTYQIVVEVKDSSETPEQPHLPEDNT